MIRLEDVSFAYSSKEKAGYVISDISVQIDAGDYVSIIGVNGSGKSTLAKLLSCILTPAQGNIYIDGLNTATPKNVRQIRTLLGVVFDNPDNQLIASSVEEEVAFGPENLEIPHEQLLKRVTDSLKTVGLEKLRFMDPNKLSGGQKQRLAIAAVLAMKPKYIVLDEATSMLDSLGSREILETLEYVNKSYGITIIHITHNMAEAARADKVLVLEKGKLVLQGSTDSIFTDTDALCRFGINPPATVFFAKRLRDKGLPISDEIIKKEKLVEELCLLNLKM